MPPKKAKKTQANKESNQAERVYEAERIIDHVTFECAYREYFVNKNERFENMFTTLSDNSRVETCKYYYLVKWKHYPEEDCTWEREKHCSSMSSLETYKKLNGLPKECLKIRCSPSPPGSGKLNIQEMQDSDVVEKEDQPYGFYPEFKTYNTVYGIVRCGELQRGTKCKETDNVTLWTMRRGQQKFILEEKNMTALLSSPFCKTDARFEKWQYDVQKKDRSYISSIIQHPNSVKMLDYYCTDKGNNRNTFIYVYIYEYFESNVRSRINGKSMKLIDTKKMFADMLSILSLLHNYGVHHNISSNHIHIDGNTYKLSHFQSFRFNTDENDTDEINDDDLSYSNAYKQIEGYMSLDEITFDIYALGIVLLESLTNRCIQSGNFDELIKKEIEMGISSLEEPQKTIVSTILNSQNYIFKKNIPRYRFTAESLQNHPWLCDDNEYCFTKVVLLISYYAKPIDELVFYEEDDVVGTVVDRLISLYFKSNLMSYQMLCMEDLNSGNTVVHYVEHEELFVNCLRKYEGLKLVIVPILSAINEEFVNSKKAISFVHFPKEFGSVPIIIESVPMSDENVCRTVIEQAFPIHHRLLPFVIVRLTPEFGRIQNEYKMCPSSAIVKNMKPVFAKISCPEEYDITEPIPDYCISIKDDPKIKEIQPLTSTDDDVTMYICEFFMAFGELTYERKSRFAEYDNDNECEQSENVPLDQEPAAKKRKVAIKKEPMHEN